MKRELTSASNLIVHFLRLEQKNIPEYKLELFNKCLFEALAEKYNGYWFPEKPQKLSRYRMVQFHSNLDRRIIEAGQKCKFSETFLIENLSPLTVWIDPNEVRYTIGENNRTFILYNQDSLEPWTPLSHDENTKCNKTSFTFFLRNFKHFLNGYRPLIYNQDSSEAWTPFHYLPFFLLFLKKTQMS